MFFKLSAHSPRESGARRMCCSSWQILHFVSVSVEPGPEMSLSSGFCANTVPAKSTAGRTPMQRRPTNERSLNLNNDPHAVPAVPEVAERIPLGHRGLGVALVVPGARNEAHIPGALRLVFVLESAPCVRMQAIGRRKVGALPGL